MGQMKGKASIEFEHPPVIISAGAVVGKKEGDGPLGQLFDQVEQDDMFGKDNWEQAESAMQKRTADLVIEKGGIRKGDLRYLFAGDLLGQLIATSFGTVDLEIPLFGLYGACSTMGEALSLGAMAVNGGYANQVMSMASSHFATAEKQFRFPLAYGNQRPMSATWTVTGCGAVVIAGDRKNGLARIAGITTGRQYPGITKVEVIETGSPADAEQYADIVDTVFAAPDQSQVPVGSLSYKTDQADTSVVLNPYEFDWQWQTEDGQTSTSQVDGSAADGNGTLNETIVDARIPNAVDAFVAFSVNPTSLEIERRPLVKGETAKIDPQSDGEDVPCTLGDDGTAALRIEPNYLYEVKATFPQGEAEYAFYTID